MLKVMHVMAGAPQGGAENIFLESVLALGEAGLDQAVVTRGNNAFRLEALRRAGIETRTASFNTLMRLGTTRTLRKTAAQFAPDIIQYWMGRAGTFAIRGPAVNVGWYGGYYKLSRFANCAYHVALTQDIADHIVAQGAAQGRVEIIHTYADFPDAAPVDRAAYDTPEDAPLLLALARLHPKKGLDVLLKALADIPGAYLWIAGEGPIEAELKALTAQLDLEARVRFLGWRDDRGALLKTADICVFPSRYEPFGTVMVDAWAAGTPLIAAAAAGTKVYVKNEDNGLLVAIDDVAGLRDAIARLIGDAALQRNLVAGGRATFEATFSKAAFQKASLAFYARIRGTV